MRKSPDKKLSGFNQDQKGGEGSHSLYKSSSYPSDSFGYTDIKYSLFCSSYKQLRACAGFYHRFDRIYMESSVIYEAGAGELCLWRDTLPEGCEVYIALPYIMRDENLPAAELSGLERIPSPGFEPEGYLVRNYEELKLITESGGNFITDFGLYCYNREAVKHFLHRGARFITLPLELNVHEMRELEASGKSELILYGRAPMMISASCLLKTTLSCMKKTGNRSRAGKDDGKDTKKWDEDLSLTLTDRYKKEFPVIRNCRECYNVIYNADPTYLGSEMKDIRRLHPAFLRIMFTDETEEECGGVLKGIFEERPLSGEYTKGHFRKSVL